MGTVAVRQSDPRRSGVPTECLTTVRGPINTLTLTAPAPDRKVIFAAVRPRRRRPVVSSLTPQD